MAAKDTPAGILQIQGVIRIAKTPRRRTQPAQPQQAVVRIPLAPTPRGLRQRQPRGQPAHIGARVFSTSIFLKGANIP